MMFKKKRKSSRKYVASNPLDFKKVKRKRYRGSGDKPKVFGVKVFFGVVMVVVLFYWLFFSAVFEVKDVILPEQANEQMESTVDDVIGKNIFLVSGSNLKKNFHALFPNLKEVVVKKDFPDLLVVEFEKYDLMVNIINESPGVKVDYILNELGYVAKEQLMDPELPTVKIISEEPINPKERVLDEEKIEFLLGVDQEFEDRLGMKVVEVIWHKRAREVHLLTERDFYVWLDVEQSVDEQLKKLKKALLKLDIWEKNLLYIDLRIPSNNGERIIYKLRE